MPIQSLGVSKWRRNQASVGVDFIPSEHNAVRRK